MGSQRPGAVPLSTCPSPSPVTKLAKRTEDETTLDVISSGQLLAA